MKASEIKTRLEDLIASEGDMDVYLYVSGAYCSPATCYKGPFNREGSAIWISDDERGVNAP